MDSHRQGIGECGIGVPERPEQPNVVPLHDKTHGSSMPLRDRLPELQQVASPQELPFRALVPAFMISELKRAFEIGFLLFVPFLVIDLVVASVLMSMGMMMLPPVVISLPFKLIFFVLVDGWRLVCGSLVESFQRGAGAG